MSPQLINEIRDLNLSFMLLAQNMVRKDWSAAASRLGISRAVAEQIGQLSPEQLLRVASRNLVLCSLKFDDNMVLGLLTDAHVQGGAPAASAAPTGHAQSPRVAAHAQ